MQKWSFYPIFGPFIRNLALNMLIEILAFEKWSFEPIGLFIHGRFNRNPL